MHSGRVKMRALEMEKEIKEEKQEDGRDKVNCKGSEVGLRK